MLLEALTCPGCAEKDNRGMAAKTAANAVPGQAECYTRMCESPGLIKVPQPFALYCRHHERASGGGTSVCTALGGSLVHTVSASTPLKEKRRVGKAHRCVLDPARQADSPMTAHQLTKDELEKVFKSGLHLPDWATLRLVSKPWKAHANSCANHVIVGLTAAEWPDQPPNKLEREVDHPCAAQAAFSRLCYVL